MKKILVLGLIVLTVGVVIGGGIFLAYRDIIKGVTLERREVEGYTVESLSSTLAHPMGPWIKITKGDSVLAESHSTITVGPIKASLDTWGSLRVEYRAPGKYIYLGRS